MNSPRNPSFVLPVTVTLAVLLALYVGAYFATVEPYGDVPWYSLNFVPEGAGPEVDRCLDWFFAPIHRLDRRIRPHVWEPTP